MREPGPPADDRSASGPDRLVTSSLPFPRVHDPVGVVTMIPCFAGDVAAQRRVVAATADVWATAPPPEGLVSVSLFASDDGGSVLSYLRWTGVDAPRGLDADPGPGAVARPFGSSWSTARSANATSSTPC